MKWNAESMENLIQKVNKSQLSPGVKARVIDLLKMTRYRSETFEWFKQEIFREFKCDFAALMKADLQA